MFGDPVWYLLTLGNLFRFEAVKISIRSALLGEDVEQGAGRGARRRDEVIKMGI